MRKHKKNITLLNTLTSLVLQVTTLINGFVITSITLNYFGSEINGLVSTLTKYLSYVTLLEGGITGVVMAILYKPLAEKNMDKVSSIINTTKKFYKKIASIFLIYAAVISIVFPLFMQKEFSYFYVFFITVILAVTSFVQYNFSYAMKNLLNSDKKVYVVALTQTVLLLANTTLAIISIKIYPNIHLFLLITAILYAIQPLIFNTYIKKHYKLDKNAKEDKNLIKARWDGFAINIAAIIKSNTDIIILSIYTTFSTVSIYNVYALVSGGLRSIMVFLSNGISPTIGQLYHSSETKKLNEIFDVYEYVIFVFTFILFGVAGLLICPFVMIYTANVADANYYQPIFAILLVISEGINLIKTAHLDLAYAANKFKELKWPGYIEAIINIVLSLILVKTFGLIGVIIGTIVALLYRMIYQVWYTKKIIKERSQKHFYTKLFSFTISTIIAILISIYLVPITEYNIFSWLWHGFLYLIIFGTFILINTMLFYKKQFKNIKLLMR